MSSGTEPRRAKNSRRKASAAPRGNAKAEAVSDRKIHGVIALVVAGLGAVVYWSLPSDKGPATVATNSGESTPTEAEDASAPAPLAGPSDATAEFAILTAKSSDAVRAIATPAEVARRLDARQCGTACEAVKKVILDDDAFEIEIRETADLLLPPRDTFDTLAPGLTPKERDSVAEHKTAVILRAHGDPLPDQLPARAAFGAASLLANVLDGFVYDEVSRRIMTARDAEAQVITAPLGGQIFDRRQIVIQLYRQEDGTARLLTLGMARFGAPDLSLRGANMGSAPMLAEVVNTVASQLAGGKTEPRQNVTLEDVARVVGKKPADISTNPSAARTATFDLVRPERIEGDPDNETTELVPPGGSNREAWDIVVAGLFGLPPNVSTLADDKELADIATKARRDLPSAIKRFEAGEGELFVKGPFAIPPDSRVDGGPATELLWIAVASCDAERCIGVLSNEPSYATNIALGKTATVLRSDAADWLIQRRDGKTVGGESVKLLKARATPR